MANEAFVTRTMKALGLGSQAALGEKVGMSRRTMQRWTVHGVPPHNLPDLVRLVYPVDAGLAAEMAAKLGHTLESMHVAPPSQPSPAPVVPPAPPPPTPDGIIDAVVCAAAEAMEMMPRDVRPGLLAAFTRAREIGVSVDMVERVLRASVAPPQATSPARARA